MPPVLQQVRGWRWGCFWEASAEGEALRLEEWREMLAWDRDGLGATIGSVFSAPCHACVQGGSMQGSCLQPPGP